MDCNFYVINKDQIIRIKRLWEKLNELHLKNSHFFKDHFRSFTFDERIKKFAEIQEDNIRIEIIENDCVPIGYCISTVENGTGEIDSLYVDEKYREQGFGGKLIENSIDWLKIKNCTKIVLAVAEGRESVFDFYRKFGFYPVMTYLQLK